MFGVEFACSVRRVDHAFRRPTRARIGEYTRQRTFEELSLVDMSRTGSIPWADSASALPARGGGIQRIGLNQQRWTQAVEEVITNPVPEVKDAALELPEPTPNGNAALVSKLVIPKEHIALLVRPPPGRSLWS